MERFKDVEVNESNVENILGSNWRQVLDYLKNLDSLSRFEILRFNKDIEDYAKNNKTNWERYIKENLRKSDDNVGQVSHSLFWATYDCYGLYAGCGVYAILAGQMNPVVSISSKFLCVVEG